MTRLPGAPPTDLRVAGRSDPGLMRSNNEDSFLLSPRVLVVADGMGGHAAGEVASRLVTDAFANLGDRPPEPSPIAALDEAVRTGNQSIAHLVARHPELDGMGTTVTALLFDGSHMAMAHVGDSRAYLYRSDVLHQLTHDDTFVQSLVDEGRITEAEAHEHPQRNLVLRALTGLRIDPLLAEREVRVGDRYMLCSDGLCGVVDPESIADALAIPDPQEAVDTLIQLALAAGGPDNITVIVADVVGIDESAHVADETPTAPHASDPESTNPIARLTREMPRVPLPPIPEEPAAPAELVMDADDDDVDDAAPIAPGPAVITPAVITPAASDPESGDPADRDPDADPSDATIDPEATDDPTTSETGAPTGTAVGDSIGDGSPSTEYDGPPAAAGPGGPGGRKPSADAGGDQRTLTTAPRRRARARWYRRGAVIVAALVLVATGIAASTIWVRHQYFVSDQGNLVVVFRGVDGSLLGWVFSTFEETSCAGETDCTPLKVSDLQPAARNQVHAGIKATSLQDARTVVERLSAQILPPCREDADPAPEATPPADGTISADTTAPTTPATPSTATTPTSAGSPTSTNATTAPAGTAAAPADPAADQVAIAEPGPAPTLFTPSSRPTQLSAGSAPTTITLDGPGGTGPRTYVLSPSTRTTSTSSTTSSTTIDATPLAPAVQIPGVTCRTMS